MGRKYINIEGEKFGKLLVTKEFKRIGKYLFWKCVCECGEISFVTSSDLKRGRINYCTKCNQQKSEKSILQVLYKNYKLNALKRNIPFNLTIDDFNKIITKNCDYCNVPPQQVLHKKGMKYDLTYNGIDRVDNNRGYSIDNCVPACKFCNLAKRNFKREEFIEWIGRIKGS
jgi:hypothetical protein